MFANKYPSIFSRQMKAIVYLNFNFLVQYSLLLKTGSLDNAIQVRLFIGLAIMVYLKIIPRARMGY